jgi:hypothetical protein
MVTLVGAEDVRGFIDPSLTQLQLWKYLPWWWFRFKEPPSRERLWGSESGRVAFCGPVACGPCGGRGEGDVLVVPGLWPAHVEGAPTCEG